MKLYGCMAVGQYNDWVEWSVGSIYNLVDKVIIADGSPFGHFDQSYREKLSAFPGADEKIEVNMVDWEYYEGEQKEHIVSGVAKVMQAAASKAWKQGADWILWASPDHVWYRNVTRVKKLVESDTRTDSWFTHYYTFTDWDKVRLHSSMKQKTGEWCDQFLARNTDDYAVVTLFKAREKPVWVQTWNSWGATPQTAHRKVSRDVWSAHTKFFSPESGRPGETRTLQYQYERQILRIKLNNRCGYYKTRLTPEQEKSYAWKAAKSILSGERQWGVPTGSWKIHPLIVPPHPPEIFSTSPLEYVKKGYP